MFKTLLFIIFAYSIIFGQSLHRYTNEIFDFTQVVTNGVYATAPELNSPYQGESFTHSSDLKFHLFVPANDTLTIRPLIIFIHGGGFVSGSKENDDMMEFCRLFAKRGYVTTTIQYRLGMNLLSSISSERAVYRGLQDGRAAIRFFKENAGIYGIDTNHIYMLGSSAGSFIGLHNLFLNEESERPAGSYLISNFPPTLDDGPDLGPLDNINASLKHGSQPNGLISCWGAIQDTILIKPNDINIPLLLIHGTADDIVPFDVGSPFNATTLPPTYGSKPINKRLLTLNTYSETYFVEGAGHEFYGVINGNWNPVPNSYWDTVVTKSSTFLWKLHKPTASFSSDNISSSVQFINTSISAEKWFWDFGDGETDSSENPLHSYASDGTYNVKLTVLNYLDSWDTTSAQVEVITTDVKNISLSKTKFQLFQNYPNPFNPSTVIEYWLPEASFVSIKIYNVLGKEVRTLVNQTQHTGNYQIQWNGLDSFGNNVAAGIYIYKITAGNFVDTKKMLLIE